MKNNERRNLNISLLVLAAGLGGMSLPFILSWDMMGGGYGTIALSGFVALAGGISVMAFRPRAAIVDRILANEGLLARWQYDSGHKEALNEEAREDIVLMRGAALILGGIFLGIGLIFFLMDPDENGLFLGIMGAVAVIIGGAGFLAAWGRKRFIGAEGSEAVFDRVGVWYAGSLTAWTPPFSVLKAVLTDPRAPGILFFVFLQLYGRMPHYHMVSLQVPVPPGQEATAQALVQAYDKAPDERVRRYMERVLTTENPEEGGDWDE